MSSDSRTRSLREGERYIQQGKISLAINEYLKIVKDDPADVLTLNIIGDLYLREGKVSEANRLFLQVAEQYTRDNFLQKAIAVYKKILNADPHNLQVNSLLASLYVHQGMSVDARSQYMFLASLCAKEGNVREVQSALAKVAEIDPTNSMVHLKLAESYQVQDRKDEAYLAFAAAARAQVKQGDFHAAMISYRRALALNIASTEALKGYLESALQAGDLKDALDQVKGSIDAASPDPALLELLGRANLGAGNIDRAEKCFQTLLGIDESKLDLLTFLSSTLLKTGDPDRALHCLEPAVPVAITRRETGKLAEAYGRILEIYPNHLATLKALAEIFSAANDGKSYTGALERIAECCLNSGNPSEALDTLERIIETAPDNERYLAWHRQVFEQAFPTSPYRLPRAIAEGDTARGLEVAAAPAASKAPGTAGSDSLIVEVDLLLNYGMKEKALELLRSLEAKRPKDMEVRSRLAILFRDLGENRLAAEQYLLMSALKREAGDEEGARQLLQNAVEFEPDLADPELDVISFAQEHGLQLEIAGSTNRARPDSLELDLSGDLSEIFFKDEKEITEAPESPSEAASDAIADELTMPVPQAAEAESIEEQLQEVDFYVRLGFNDEARAKLSQIAANCPDHPDLSPRCEQLGIDLDAIRRKAPLAPAGSPSQDAAGPPLAAPPEDFLLAELQKPPQIGEEGELKGESSVSSAGAPASSQDAAALDTAGTTLGTDDTASAKPVFAAPTSAPADSPAQTNSMFVDLIEEVNALTNQEITREDFETHFNLGIAFREMGLPEDAIKEFQIAVKALDRGSSPTEFVQCCGMLSTCFLERNMPRSAIRWCQTGLTVKEISTHESMALQYDMAVAYASVGDIIRAVACFEIIFGFDPGYRDVAQRIDALKSGTERHAL